MVGGETPPYGVYAYSKIERLLFNIAYSHLFMESKLYQMLVQ